MRTMALVVLLLLAGPVPAPAIARAGEEATQEAKKGDQKKVDAVTSASPDAVTGASPDAVTGATKTAKKEELSGEIGDYDPFAE